MLSVSLDLTVVKVNICQSLLFLHELLQHDILPQHSYDEHRISESFTQTSSTSSYLKHTVSSMKGDEPDKIKINIWAYFQANQVN